MLNKKRKKEKNKKKAKSSDPWKKFQRKYSTYAYKILGKRFSDDLKYKHLGDQLKMANIHLTPSIFLSTIIFTGTIITIISFFIYLFIFNTIIGSSSWVLYVIGLTILNSVASFIYMPLLVRMKISTRRLQIERELPFTLSELSVLASTGLTPIKIFRHMASRNLSPAMNTEFRKIVHKIDIEGKDIVTAIGETAKESPSSVFRENLWDLSNMIHQGGDLDVYLRQKADNTLQLRRDIQEEFTEQLMSYSEMYMSLVLISILFIGIAAFLMDAMASTMGGIDADTLLILLAYGIIPVAVIVVNVIISSAYSKSG